MALVRSIIHLLAFSTLLLNAPLSLSVQEPISIVIDNPVKKGTLIKRMPLFLGFLHDADPNFSTMISFLQKDLELSGQFHVTSQLGALPTHKEEIKALHDKGFSLAIFINKSADGRGFEWRLYNTAQALLEKGKKTHKVGTSPSDWAHIIAQDLWQELMGSPGPFASRLCYIRKTRDPRFSSRWIRHLCISDITGSQERVILSTRHITIAPYWSPPSTSPYIIYSQFTRSNVRLVAVNMQKKRRIVLDFDGTNAGVSFQQDGRAIIYGRSGKIWGYHYDPERRKGIHKLLIREKDTCALPTLLSQGDIIYCSQGKIKYYDAANKKRRILVGEGYNVGASCHEKSNKIVYSRRVKGILQLFLYDLKTKKTEQLTRDNGDKTDPCWSPCGNWVAFCLETRGSSRIAIINIKTNQRIVVTSAQHHCHYPSWSPLYTTLPALT